MSSFIHGYSFFFIVLSIAFLLSRIHTLPLPDNPYDTFIEFLRKNNCTMPEEVELQFPPSSDPSAPFSYLSSPMTECQTSDALEENDEAKFMCREIFDVLQNITCFEYNITLPKIKSKPLSENICNDFKSMEGILPKNDYLSGKLVDDTVCKVLCTKNKYAMLCKMLLWSHDIQAKIESALENDAKVNEKETINKNAASSSMGASSIKVSIAEEKIHSNEEEMNNEIADKEINADNQEKDKKKTGGTGSKNLGSVNTSTLSTPGQTASGKIDGSTIDYQNGLDMKTSITAEMPVSSKNKSEADNQKVVNVSPPVDSNKKLPPTVNNDQNEIKDDIYPDHGKVGKNIPVSDVTVAASLTSKVNSVKNTRKNNSLIIFPNKGNNTTISNTSTEANADSDNFVSKNSGIDKNLNNANIEGKNEKVELEQTNLKKNEDDQKVEKPKLTDFEIPIRGSPAIDLKQIESTTLQILPDKDKNIEHQEDKDQEQYPEEYNENENEGDYPKPEYDNSFSQPMKNRESIDKSSVKEGSNQMSNSYDPFISRNRHAHENIPVIPSFPEQEDSHFFFYFLSIVLILMAGYLIFHNKQKIIALIVEGRHERRRRSHGAGYKKLETK